MVWNSSGQWSGTCLIRGHFGLELLWSEATSSALRAHNDLRAHTRLIRGHFGLGRSDQRSHLSGTVWSEVISSATSTWGIISFNWNRERVVMYFYTYSGRGLVVKFRKKCSEMRWKKIFHRVVLTSFCAECSESRWIIYFHSVLRILTKKNRPYTG